MPRLLAIGDIHGCSNALRALLVSVKIQPDDIVVTLGDYLDRGPDSKEVIEQLIELQNQCTLIPLLGNHEQMWIAALESSADHQSWLWNGGDATLAAYGVSSARDLPEQHQKFLRSCRLYHEEERHFFVHANADPWVPIDSQAEQALLWQFLHDAPALHESGKLMICGHTPQENGCPRDFGSAICIDTNVARKGWLTCLEVRRRCFWQAREDGMTRGPDVL